MVQSDKNIKQLTTTTLKKNLQEAITIETAEAD